MRPQNATDLLAEVRIAFQKASAGETERFYIRHAACDFRCEVVGGGLSSVIRNVHACTSADVGVEARNLFTIRAWDTASSGVPFPELIWADGSVISNGTVSGWNTEEASFLIQQLERVFTVIDHRARTAYVWTPDADHLDYAERCRPFSNALHAGLKPGGYCLAHAAGVAVGGRGVLFAGASGSGKSTLAVAAMLRGMQYAGDDRIILGMREGHPHMDAAYATASLDKRAVALLPGIEQFAADSGNGAHAKRAFHFDKSRMCGSAPVAAILCPEVGGNGPAISPVPSAQGLLRLAPSSVFIPVGGGCSEFKNMAAVVRSTPCFRFALGMEPVAAARFLESWAAENL